MIDMRFKKGLKGRHDTTTAVQNRVGLALEIMIYDRGVIECLR
jgi:hypothetical protein